MLSCFSLIAILPIFFWSKTYSLFFPTFRVSLIFYFYWYFSFYFSCLLTSFSLFDTKFNFYPKSKFSSSDKSLNRSQLVFVSSQFLFSLFFDRKRKCFLSFFFGFIWSFLKSYILGVFSLCVLWNQALPSCSSLSSPSTSRSGKEKIWSLQWWH